MNVLLLLLVLFQPPLTPSPDPIGVDGPSASSDDVSDCADLLLRLQAAELAVAQQQITIEWLSAILDTIDSEAEPAAWLDAWHELLAAMDQLEELRLQAWLLSGRYIDAGCL